MKMIELPVFFHTDESAEMTRLDLEFELSDCEQREVTFYTIDCITPYIDGDNSFCRIHSSGTTFISPVSYYEVKKMLNKKGY